MSETKIQLPKVDVAMIQRITSQVIRLQKLATKLRKDLGLGDQHGMDVIDPGLGSVKVEKPRGEKPNKASVQDSTPKVESDRGSVAKTEEVASQTKSSTNGTRSKGTLSTQPKAQSPKTKHKRNWTGRSKKSGTNYPTQPANNPQKAASDLEKVDETQKDYEAIAAFNQQLEELKQSVARDGKATIHLDQTAGESASDKNSPSSTQVIEIQGALERLGSEVGVLKSMIEPIQDVNRDALNFVQDFDSELERETDPTNTDKKKANLKKQKKKRLSRPKKTVGERVRGWFKRTDREHERR